MLSLKAFKIPEDGLLNPHILASSNNINSNHLVYISSHNLRFLQSKSFPLLQIQNLELKIHTLVFSVEINEEYLKNEKVLESIEIKIFLSPEVFHFLRLKKGQEVSLVLMNTVLPIRNYEPNSLFNYFPVLPIAKRVYLTNV